MRSGGFPFGRKELASRNGFGRGRRPTLEFTHRVDNEGRPLPAHEAELRDLAAELAQREGIDGRPIQPPFLQSGQEVTWADLRRMWNQLYAHWAFKSPDLRVFRNAAVRARRYLLEPPELDDMAAGTWQWVHRRAARLASSAGDFFGLPANRVVELGSRIEI